jgi:hypothetical protein
MTTMDRAYRQGYVDALRAARRLLSHKHAQAINAVPEAPMRVPSYLRQKDYDRAVGAAGALFDATYAVGELALGAAMPADQAEARPAEIAATKEG